MFACRCGALKELAGSRHAWHEQLDPVGLVHMNGRVYDPELGRFLSPDAVIQDVTNLQTINAYSYVLNNPLSLTDPTGFFFQGLFRAIGGAFKAAFRAMRAAFRAVLRSAIGRAIIQIIACIPSPVSAATCAGAAAAMTLATGGSIVDAIKSAAFAFVQMGTWTGVHVVVEGMSILGKSLVHGVVGGALSVAQGGGFVQGFAANAIGALGGGLAEGIAPDVVANTAIVSAAGCAAAAVAGGKCAQGAVTAAFANIYNRFGGSYWSDVQQGTVAWFESKVKSLFSFYSSLIPGSGAVECLAEGCGTGGWAMAAAGSLPAARVGSKLVYRGLAEGEDIAAGLWARNPGGNISEISHVAGARSSSQWISTTKDLETALNKYGQYGVVEIDLSKVSSQIKDISGGLPNGGRMSNWAVRDAEVLIRDHVPPSAMRRIK